ncbi:hypothetical protein DITRI_Ditri02bG0141100 [Diplodiscus trichospermus]
MVTERGQSSSSMAGRAAAEPRRRSPLTMATLQIIKNRANKRTDRRKPGSTILYYDNTDNGYGWLLPGWIAEERYMPSGRLYRYYYDPAGNLYRTQREVLYTWSQSGMICLDY